MPTEMPKAAATAARVGDTDRFSPMSRVATTEAATESRSPSRMPVTPPRALVEAASMTNCCMM